MWLIRELKPDYHTVADFRKDNITLLKNIFKHFSLLCNELGLLGKEIVAIDIDKITVLADKGYYTGECLEKCEEDKIITIVSKQKAPSSTGNSDYIVDNFKYDSDNDCYICPKGQTLCKRK